MVLYVLSVSAVSLLWCITACIEDVVHVRRQKEIVREWQTACVRRGAGHWNTMPSGSVTFVWDLPEKDT